MYMAKRAQSEQAPRGNLALIHVCCGQKTLKNLLEMDGLLACSLRGRIVISADNLHLGLALKISVLICNYNYADYIALCVESVLSQSRKPFEIIVVDDGSTDSSLDVLAAYGPQIRICRKSNGGQLSAFIEGIRHCSGDYVFLLDSDDFWLPEHLARMTEAIARHDRPDLIFSSAEVVTRDSVRTGKILGAMASDVDVQDLGYSFLLFRYFPRWRGSQTSTLGIKRHALEEITRKSDASFVNRFRTNADDVIVLGADLLGFRKLFIASPTVCYRVHGGNAWYQSAWSSQKYYSRYIGHCLIYDAMVVKSPLNPSDFSGDAFAQEFATKSGVPFQEALLYIKAVLLHGGRRKTRQILAIVAHWRQFGSTQNRLLKLLLKKSSAAASGVRPGGKAAANTPG